MRKKRTLQSAEEVASKLTFPPTTLPAVALRGEDGVGRSSSSGDGQQENPFVETGSASCAREPSPALRPAEKRKPKRPVGGDGGFVAEGTASVESQMLTA